MTEDRRREAAARRRQSERYYIDGNTARRLNPDTEIYPRKKKKVQKEQPVVRYEKRQAAFDRKYMLFLVVSVGITLGSCFSYMQSHMRLTEMKQSVTVLQAQLQDIQDQNRALEEGLNMNIDLNEVYQEATGRLGMVYADESQVIYYNSSNDDYVRQYESIPDKN